MLSTNCYDISHTCTHITVSPEDGVTVSPTSSRSMVGEIVELTCATEGGPGNSFSWTSPNGSDLGDNTTITVEVTDVFAGGQYTCEVENEAGVETASSVIYGVLRN